MQEVASGAARAVDEERLWRRHCELARCGATPAGGVNRQALSPQEAQARAVLVRWGEAIGCRPFTDAIGNLFLRLEGSDPGLEPVLTGSHIDSQPTGGRFDGAFGVLAGLEALQAIVETGTSPRRPIEVVAWTNEEGSRFAPGMMGSEVFTGVRSLESVLAVRDADGVSVAEALQAVLAATPHVPMRPLGFPVAAFIEAHIEQGPALEAAGCPIGVVTGIQGVRRFRVEVQGEEAHAGTTARRQRRDALMAAAHMMVALERSVMPFEDEVRFTVGMIRPAPNVPSVVAGHVLFSIDLRHPDDATLRTVGDAFEDICRREARGCEVAVREIAAAPSLHFPHAMLDRIRRAAQRLGLAHMDIFSGAGHDARQLHYHCPTGMIFVPCERGISHKESENAKPSDLAAGAQVLTEVLVELAA